MKPNWSAIRIWTCNKSIMTPNEVVWYHRIGYIENMRSKKEKKSISVQNMQVLKSSKIRNWNSVY